MIIQIGNNYISLQADISADVGQVTGDQIMLEDPTWVKSLKEQHQSSIMEILVVRELASSKDYHSNGTEPRNGCEINISKNTHST